MAIEKSGKRERDAVLFCIYRLVLLLLNFFTVVINAVAESASVLITLSYLHPKGVFTLAIFARDFALSLHVLLPKNFFFITKHASLVRNCT
jgi:hypothetical protein